MISCFALLLLTPCGIVQPQPQVLRFATFNVSLHRRTAGQLAAELGVVGNQQARQVAEIVQRVRPHVLLINEFDYDAAHLAARMFLKNYLSVGQNGQRPIAYPHFFAAPVNTGVPSKRDLNRDGRNDGPADAYGFGWFPGQYGMVVFSMFPFQRDGVRTLQSFLWKDLPRAESPVMPNRGQPYYSAETWEALRLSSKSHWDLPISIGPHRVHFLCAHPTPPVFDGPEDRNGARNFDEIRLLADYLDPARSEYIYDDQGRRGGLEAGSYFIVAGDLNADPHDGDSRDGAAAQLTEHPLIHRGPPPASGGAAEKARLDAGVNDQQQGNPAHDTADFKDDRAGNLRVDYVLPSAQLSLRRQGVFWPRQADEGYDLIGASDHRLVWIDVELDSNDRAP